MNSEFQNGGGGNGGTPDSAYVNSSRHLSEDELVSFALQLVPVDQSGLMLAHLNECLVCRDALAVIQGNLVVYALTSEPQALPAGARDRFLERLGSEVQNHRSTITDSEVSDARTTEVNPAATANGAAKRDVRAAEAPLVFPAARGASRGRDTAALAWVGWALAAAVSVFAFLQFQQRQNLQHTLATESASMQQLQQQSAAVQQHASAEQEQATVAREDAARSEQALDRTARAQEVLQTLTASGAMQVSLQLPTQKAPPPQAHAAYLERTGALVLVASHLRPLATGKTYELWLLPADPKGSPVPAGLFKPNSSGFASVVLPKLPRGIAAKGFGITVEPDGGSAGPTLPIVLAGTGS